MSAKQIAGKEKETPKETIFKEIALQLSQALPTLKESLGEKKFDKRIKKAAKLLGEGIKTGGTKKTAVPKIPTVKNKEGKAKVASPGKKATKPAK